jgi:hypothetical protein
MRRTDGYRCGTALPREYGRWATGRKNMPIQQCPMCLQTKNVVSSHLIPAKVYDYLHAPGTHPISISKEFFAVPCGHARESARVARCDLKPNREPTGSGRAGGRSIRRCRRRWPEIVDTGGSPRIFSCRFAGALGQGLHRNRASASLARIDRRDSRGSG